MWAYNYTDELYHYGVLGMKWGHRKTIKTTNGSDDVRDKMEKKLKQSKRIRKAGVVMKLAGAAAEIASKNVYNKKRAGASNLDVAIVKGGQYVGKILKKAGSITVSASYINQISAYDKYKRESRQQMLAK